MGRLIQDVRFALRTFVRGRFVTVLALMAFGLGIGVTAAVFSIFNAVVLNSIPYPDPASLVLVYDTQPALSTAPASYPKYIAWRDRNQVFSAIGGSTPRSLVLTGSGEAERVVGIAATDSLVRVFDVHPQLGRWFTGKEDTPGGPKVAVLGFGFWNRRFSGDRSVIGRRLLIDGEPYEVIGVMPAAFTHRGGEIYLPLQAVYDPSARGTHFLSTYARLKPGVTLERAATDMRTLGEHLATEFGHNHGVDVVSLREAVVGGVRLPMRVLLGAVFLVLLIACANVANLLLASGMARRQELAIRLALGARQRDLARQLTIESVLLALAGGAIGILLASWIVRTFMTMAAAVLPRADTIRIDNRVLAFTAVLSLTVGVVCGLWPLIRLRTRELAHAVRETDTRTGSGSKGFGNGLVVAEIAIAFALFVGAGLFIKNLVLLLDRDTGMAIERVVSFDVAPAGPRYREQGRTAAFYTEVLERLRGVGGVASVGVVSHLPMYRFGFNGEMAIEGGNPWGPGQAPLVEYRWIAGDYFKTMGIKLLQGRLFDERDSRGSTPVVVINKAMADKFWPGQDPLGKRVAQGSSGTNWLQVIGVIADVRSYGLSRNTPYELYFTIYQNPFASMSVVMRTTTDDPSAVLRSARQIVAGIDPALPVTGVQTMEQVVRASVGQPRLMSALTTLFGILAGLLAMVGIYGVTAYNVRRQRREFGIRLALGADPRRVQRLVVWRGALTGIAGVALGIVGALVLSQLVKAMLNDVEAADPAVFGVCSGLALLVAVLAAYFPARAAGRVDPMLVLRDT